MTSTKSRKPRTRPFYLIKDGDLLGIVYSDQKADAETKAARVAEREGFSDYIVSSSQAMIKDERPK